MLYEATREEFRRLNPPVRESGACLYWAVAAVRAANRLKKQGDLPEGLNFQIQAGTALWVSSRVEAGDNAFGYQFDLVEAIAQVKTGFFPEVHCWVGCPDTGLLFDPTTGFQPEQAEILLGKKIFAEPLPPYLICLDTLPDWAKYVPDMMAICLMHSFLKAIGLSVED
jgi:hypothetical protein